MCLCFHPSLLVQGGGDSAAPPPAPVVDDAAAEALREQVRSLTATVKSLQSHGDPAQLVAKVSSLEAAMRDLRASHDAEVKEHATRLADAGTMTPRVQLPPGAHTASLCECTGGAAQLGFSLVVSLQCRGSLSAVPNVLVCSCCACGGDPAVGKQRQLIRIAGILFTCVGLVGSRQRAVSIRRRVSSID